MGDFNQWDRDSHPMKSQPDGSWLIQILLPLGYHHYLYLVDGEPTLDPAACGIARDEFGQKVSLLAVC
jgi:1,4-alpha-glucan branching enzyme